MPSGGGAEPTEVNAPSKAYQNEVKARERNEVDTSSLQLASWPHLSIAQGIGGRLPDMTMAPKFKSPFQMLATYPATLSTAKSCRQLTP